MYNVKYQIQLTSGVWKKPNKAKIHDAPVGVYKPQTSNKKGKNIDIVSEWSNSLYVISWPWAGSYLPETAPEPRWDTLTSRLVLDVFCESTWLVWKEKLDVVVL